MELRILTEKEMETIYYCDMQRDFPKEEIKPLKTILELRKQKHYQCYGGFKGQKICAYLFLVWEHKNLAMLDYFAVLPEFRGQGIGSEALSLVSLEMKREGFSGILFEIERISLAVNKEQEDMRIRRKKFYLRAGCRESGLKSEIFGVGYEVLYLLLAKKQVNCEREREIREVREIREIREILDRQRMELELQDIESAYTEIYRRMVKKKYYDENIWIHVD